MPRITATGIVLVTQSEYYSKIKQNLLAIDAEWVLDSNSPDGQKTLFESRMCSELEQESALVRASIDPRQAKGSQVDDLAALFDTQRKTKRQSVAEWELVGTAGTVVPSGSQIINISTNEIWALDADVVIPGNGVFTSVEYGLINISGGFKPNRLITGWDSVQNPSNFEIGRFDEKDAELEARRKARVTESSRAMRSSIAAAIMGIENVNDCVVVENDEKTTVDGIPPNTVYCVVDGGDEIEICQAIDGTMVPGIPLKGSIEHRVFADDLDKYGKVIRFDRPSYTNVFVKFLMSDANLLSQYEKVEIGKNVEKYAIGDVSAPFSSNNDGLHMGQSVSADLMAVPLNWAIGDKIANDSDLYTVKTQFSKDGSAWVDNYLTIGAFEVPVFSSSRVLVETA